MAVVLSIAAPLGSLRPFSAPSEAQSRRADRAGARGVRQTATISRMDSAIELHGLRRDFGERTALAGVSLELAARETLLVLGPNGAGKTTLLRVLATLLRPSGGSARILGCELPDEAWKLRGRVGYLGH